MSSGKPTAAKRARTRETPAIEDEAEPVVVATECPPSVHPDDFEHLKHLSAMAADRTLLSLLPMPKAAYGALGVKPPGTASLADAALACFMKPSRERYTTNEVEVRDLRTTHTAADFPVFYTGPAHPHMLPEGGARIIVHGASDAVEAKDDDESMGATIVPACVGGPRTFNNAGAAAGAGAF